MAHKLGMIGYCAALLRKRAMLHFSVIFPCGKDAMSLMRRWEVIKNPGGADPAGVVGDEGRALSMEFALALVDRWHRDGFLRSQVLGKWTIETVVAQLLKDLGGPASGAGDGEDRGEQIGRDTQRVVDGG